VVSALQINAGGQVTGVKVVFASHPGFVRPALSRIIASKFTAALRHDQPVEASGQLTSTFVALNRLGLPIMGSMQRIPEKIPGLPPDYDYDIPPSLQKFCEPAYPRQLLEKEVRGEAAVRFILDDKGRVVAGEVLEATHPDFGAALLAAVETWIFSPAIRNGVATKTVIETKQKFLPYGFRRSTPETAMIKELRKGGKKIQPVEGLDKPPKAVYRIEPQYPRALLATKARGSAEIEAIIHETGEVTLPTVISATGPEFGWAALNAVQQWVFDVPLAKGKPVSVRIRIPLTFDP
jgi:TonB family protein